MSHDESGRPQDDLARDLYLEFALREAAGEAADFDELCSRFPSLAAELRRRRDGARSTSFGHDVSEDAAEPAEPEGELGRGGMGVVYRVWDERLERTLAKKVLRTTARGAADPHSRRTRLERFLTEARITAKLDHPGIVPVHELGFDADGRPFFTMRLVDGRQLREVFECVWRKSEGWNLARAVGVLLKVCETLDYAHQKGVVHRDVKPANVMVGRFGEVYVMDWGVARVASSELTHSPTSAGHLQAGGDGQLTSDGDVLGTAMYMAPEQARGERETIGPLVDVYAVGAMLYHLLARTPPFVDARSGSDTAAVLERVRSGPPERLAHLAPSAPPELAAVCSKSMARDPASRYGSMADLAVDLRAWLEGRVVKAHRTGAWTELRAWMRRNPAAATLACAVGLSLIVLVFALEETIRARRDLEYYGSLGEPSDLRRRFATLWPAIPQNCARMERWIADTEGVLARVGDAGDLRERLGRLREIALPPSPDDLAREADERDAHMTRLLRLVRHYEEQCAWLRARGPGVVNDQNESLEQALAVLEIWKERVRAADQRVLPRNSWRFADAYDQLLHDRMVAMLKDMEFVLPEAEGGGPLACVREGLEFARVIEQRSIRDAAEAWSEAIASIASREQCPQYDGLMIRPQRGLVPIGRDLRSGLWEFAHLQSGEPAVRRANGLLDVREETGIVLVLLPGGRFRQGTQSKEPDGENFDPLHQFDEGPRIGLLIDPYFVSKFELTRAQWFRATRAALDPSDGVDEASGVRGGTLPIVRIDWGRASDVLKQLDLELPSEAQWEFAARGGGPVTWWFGDSFDELARHANLLDLVHVSLVSDVQEFSWLDFVPMADGWLGIAPVGVLCPNPFGLHDVLGNASEWCADTGAPAYEATRLLGTGLRQGTAGNLRMHRGGSAGSPWPAARIGARAWLGTDTIPDCVGVRPSRRLDVR